jgi:hypothetical protein
LHSIEKYSPQSVGVQAQILPPKKIPAQGGDNLGVRMTALGEEESV